MDTYLCAYFQNVLESDTSSREFSLQKHHHIMIMFLNLFRLGSPRALCSFLFEVALKRCDLFVERCDVLLDDKC